MIPVWIEITEETGETWTKKMMFPALPPLETMLQLEPAKGGAGSGGMLELNQLFFDERNGNYFGLATVVDQFDYDAMGWTSGYYWDLMDDLAADAAEAAAERPGHWTEVPEYPVDDWKYEVSQDDTRLGYSDWVAHKREGEEGEAE